VSEPSSQPPLEPLTLWREWAAQAEEQWNRYFNQIMGSETFAARLAGEESAARTAG
jgi:hypothetical protein